jgi:CHAT domain-containing protein
MEGVILFSTFLENNFEGKFVKLANYSVETFKSEISEYDLLHLATHACVNSTDIMLSEIHFSDGFISIYDLQALAIKPKLQILGACNSGTGKLSVGEGVISISRGFIEAGVESIQSGMWTLDDFSTSKITQGMYLYLKEGHSKSNALRLAKLDFIKSSDRLRKHPYFWAGMVSVGDDSPLFKMSILGNYLYWVFGVFSVILLVILFWFKGRKS